jgi:hypothetical protein
MNGKSGKLEDYTIVAWMVNDIDIWPEQYWYDWA